MSDCLLFPLPPNNVLRPTANTSMVAASPFFAKIGALLLFKELLHGSYIDGVQHIDIMIHIAREILTQYDIHMAYTLIVVMREICI